MKLWMYGIIAAALLAGVLGYGHTRFKAGEAKVQIVLDDERLTWASSFAAQKLLTAATDKQNAELSQRIQDEYLPKLEAAESGAADVARRLRHYKIRANRCAVSATDGSSGDSDATSRESADPEGIDAATQRHFSACARDSERLTMWQTFYSQLRTAQ